MFYEINDNKRLVEILNCFLWEIVSDYVDHDAESLKEVLRSKCYLDIDCIDKISSAEVQTSDEFIIRGFTEKDGILAINFEMPAIIIAKSASGCVCYSVTACCEGIAEVPDVNSCEWNSVNMNFEDMGRVKLLSFSHLVKSLCLSYEEVEADDLNA